jgi:RNA polymerase sigma-70 factor, ECF subfamily
MPKALTTWSATGVPERPGAWLTTTARNRAIDLIRRAASFRADLPLLADDELVPGPADGDDIGDERLRLVFTCCHPALAPETQVALTLRLVCGLTTAQKKIAVARIPYRMLTDARRAARLDPAGALVLLADQDRGLWDRVAVRKGQALVRRALRLGPAGQFAVRAALAAVHSESPSWEATDWQEIVGLYDVLLARDSGAPLKREPPTRRVSRSPRTRPSARR